MPSNVRPARQELLELLDSGRDGAPARLQVSVVSGHKADLALLVDGPRSAGHRPGPKAIRASGLGTCFVPAWSFVSITEVSEYVPTIAQYADRLRREGTAETDPAYSAKLAAYERRLPIMNKAAAVS